MTTHQQHEQTPRAGTEYRAAGVHIGLTVLVAGLALAVSLAVTGTLADAMLIAMTIIVLLGALAGLVRTYRNWRAGGRWQVWQGASWLLLAMFIFTLMATTPVLLS